MVEHGVTGYLAPLGDVDKMAEYAISVLSDCMLCQSLSRASIARAGALFDYHKIVPQYEAVYERVLA